MNKVACALFVFDRPGYLSQVLASLEAQTFKDVDWFVFVDGNYVGDKVIGDIHGRLKCIQQLFTSKINFKGSFVFEDNRGMGKQKLASHQLYKDYDTVLFFEDDMVLSKHYIEVLLQMKKEYPEYAFISACDRPMLTEEKLKDQPLTKVIGGEVGNLCHFWGYYLSKEAVEMLQVPLEEYCTMVGENYRERPELKIKEAYGVKQTSHDGILNLFLDKSNFKRISLKIPRGRYIGELGMHCTPQIFAQYHKKQYEFEEEPFRYDPNN